METRDIIGLLILAVVSLICIITLIMVYFYNRECDRRWNAICGEYYRKGFRKYRIYHLGDKYTRAEILEILSGEGVKENLIYEDSEKIEYLTESKLPLVIRMTH